MMEKKEPASKKQRRGGTPAARQSLVRQQSDGSSVRSGLATQVGAASVWRSSFAEATAAATAVGGKTAPVLPQKTDVLIGRGRGITEWDGNKVFQTVVEEYQEKYNETTRDARGSVCNEVVGEVKKWGRFLERSKADGLWYVAGDDKARKKVGQALRYRIRQSSFTEAQPSRKSPENNPFSDTEGSSLPALDSPQHKHGGVVDAAQRDSLSPTPLSHDLPHLSLLSQQNQTPLEPLQDFPSEVGSDHGLFEGLIVMDHHHPSPDATKNNHPLQHQQPATPQPHQATDRAVASNAMAFQLEDTAKPAARSEPETSGMAPGTTDNSLRALVMGQPSSQQHRFQQHHTSWDAPKPFSLLPLSVPSDPSSLVLGQQHQPAQQPPFNTQRLSPQQPPLLSDFEILDSIGYGNVAFLDAPTPNNQDNAASINDDLSISTLSS